MRLRGACAGSMEGLSCSPPLERRNSLKKASPAAARKAMRPSPSPPISPMTPSPKQPSTRGLKNSPPPGSITTATREQVVPVHSLTTLLDAAREDKRCTFSTPNSDPIYVAYHDEEWGVPVYDDKMLFELLVLTTAQVGSDWTAVLKKRLLLRDAFAGFDAQVVADGTAMDLDGFGKALMVVGGAGKCTGYDRLWLRVGDRSISTETCGSIRFGYKIPDLMMYLQSGMCLSSKPAQVGESRLQFGQIYTDEFGCGSDRDPRVENGSRLKFGCQLRLR